MPLSLRVGGVFLESGVAIDSSATMIQDVAIAFKAKNFSNAIALEADAGKIYAPVSPGKLLDFRQSNPLRSQKFPFCSSIENSSPGAETGEGFSARRGTGRRMAANKVA
jgi:hypothetical protein